MYVHPYSQQLPHVNARLGCMEVRFGNDVFGLLEILTRGVHLQLAYFKVSLPSSE